MRALLSGNISSIVMGSNSFDAVILGILLNRILVEIFSGAFRDFSAANVFASNFFMNSEMEINFQVIEPTLIEGYLSLT